MAEYMIPAEPAGPVCDADGEEWERKADGWETEGLPPQSWGDLLTLFGPLSDYPPEPAHGTRWVAKNGGVWEWRRSEYGAALHSPMCRDDCDANDGWRRGYRILGPLTPYVEPELELEPEPGWLDAPAVLARHKDWDKKSDLRVFERIGDGLWSWDHWVRAEAWDLRDVTPLYPKEQEA